MSKDDDARATMAAHRFLLSFERAATLSSDDKELLILVFMTGWMSGRAETFDEERVLLREQNALLKAQTPFLEEIVRLRKHAEATGSLPPDIELRLLRLERAALAELKP